MEDFYGDIKSSHYEHIYNEIWWFKSSYSIVNALKVLSKVFYVISPYHHRHVGYKMCIAKHRYYVSDLE